MAVARRFTAIACAAAQTTDDRARGDLRARDTRYTFVAIAGVAASRRPRAAGGGLRPEPTEKRMPTMTGHTPQRVPTRLRCATPSRRTISPIQHDQVSCGKAEQYEKTGNPVGDRRPGAARSRPERRGTRRPVVFIGARLRHVRAPAGFANGNERGLDGRARMTAKIRVHGRNRAPDVLRTRSEAASTRSPYRRRRHPPPTRHRPPDAHQRPATDPTEDPVRVGDDEDPERQHPDAQHRQERQEATDDARDAQRHGTIT